MRTHLVLVGAIVGLTAMGCAHQAQPSGVGEEKPPLLAEIASAGTMSSRPGSAPSAALGQAVPTLGLRRGPADLTASTPGLHGPPSAPRQQTTIGSIEFCDKQAPSPTSEAPWQSAKGSGLQPATFDRLHDPSQMKLGSGSGYVPPEPSALGTGQPPSPWTAGSNQRSNPLPILTRADSPDEPKEPKRGTMHFDNTEIHKAIEILSRDGGFNILVSPGVEGSVTANLRDVTPDEALDALMKLTGLIAQRDGRFTYIYTPEEVRSGLGPDQWISTRVYHLNYVRSSDLQALIAEHLTPKIGKITVTPEAIAGGQGNHGGGGSSPPAGGGGGTGGAAPAGGGAAPGGGAGGAHGGGNHFAGDAVVIVQDRIAVLRDIDQIVAQLDVPPLQVDIEAVIISVEHDHNTEFGVNVALADTTGNVLGVLGDGSKLNATVGFVPGLPFRVGASLANGGTGGTTSSGGATQGAGFMGAEHGLKFGSTRGGVTDLVRALKTTGKVDILARPHLLVLDHQEASLLLGDKLGYSTLSQTQVSTTQNVQFLNVGTKLHVQPFISKDGLVRMVVHPERSSGRVVDNIPQTSTSEVTTDVLVPDGYTLIIAGLVDDVKDRHQNGLPLVGDLPFIGTFFRERLMNHTRKELVVLLTPRIWSPGHPAPGPMAVQPPTLSPPP